MNADQMIRISGFRQVKVLSRKEKQEREVSWNPRFNVERMPEYNAAKDRYLQNLLQTGKNKKFIISGKRKIRIRSPKSIQKSSSSKRIAETYNLSSKMQTLTRLQQEIEAIYITKGIPIDFFKLLIRKVESLEAKVAIQLLNKHLLEVNNDKSTVQRALKAVKIRERFLQHMQDSLNTDKLDKKTVSDLISMASIYSIKAVEAIISWRSESGNSNLTLEFPYKGQNYLFQMSKDLKFLKNSKFSVYLEEKVFENFIPAFCEKIFKNFKKRWQQAEDWIRQELSFSSKQSVFELKSNRIETEGNEENFKSIEKEGEGQGQGYDGALSGFRIGERKGEVDKLVEDFEKDVPEQIRNCLGAPVEAYKKALGLKFPSFLWIVNGKEVVGFFILNLENQKTLQKRLFLSHVSAKSLEDLGKVVEMVIEFCKENYPCDEIRVALNSPENSQGKYESDKAIKLFFDNLGFRWKVLIKDKTDVPVHILGLSIKKPEVSSSLSLPNQFLFQDSIKFVYYCAGQYQSSQSQSLTQSSSYLSDIGLSMVLKHLDQHSPSLPPSIHKILNKVNQNWSAPAFKLSSHSDLHSANQETSKLGLHPAKLEDSESVLAICSIELNWVRFLTTIYKKTKFLYIHGCEIDVMLSGTYKVFIIPTEDPNFNIFLIPHQGKLNDPLKESKEILAKISEVKEKIQEIWIPEFKIIENRCRNLAEDGLVVQEELQVFVKAPIHGLGNLKVEPGPTALVVNESFLFGLVNSKVDEEFEVPYVASFVASSQFSYLD